MKQHFFVFDPSLCFGCQGCVAACINVNQIKGDQQWRKVFKLPPHHDNNDTMYLSMSCNHCADPPCVKVCPANAMQVRKKDGIVILDQDKCLGCRYCQMACPFDAIVWMDDKKTVGKCNLCHQRLDNGQEPACVETCFSGALQFVSLETGREKEDWLKEIIGFEYHQDVKPRLRFVRNFKITPPGEIK